MHLSTHTAQASDNVLLSNTRLPHWSWGQPGHYYDSAGYRYVFGGGGRTSKDRCDPATVLRRPLRRLADGSRPPTPRGSLPPFGWDSVATPIRPITSRHSLSPRSATRSPIGWSYDFPTPRGGL